MTLFMFVYVCLLFAGWLAIVKIGDLPIINVNCTILYFYVTCTLRFREA